MRIRLSRILKRILPRFSCPDKENLSEVTILSQWIHSRCVKPSCGSVSCTGISDVLRCLAGEKKYIPSMPGLAALKARSERVCIGENKRQKLSATVPTGDHCSQPERQHGIDMFSQCIPGPLSRAWTTRIPGALDDAGANRPALCLELWILHQGGSSLKVLSMHLDAFPLSGRKLADGQPYVQAQQSHDV